MKALFIFISLSLGLGFSHSAFAESASINCDGFTVTADEGTMIYVGRDSEPPMMLMGGQTHTYPFFQMSNNTLENHSYALVILDPITGEKLGSRYDTVTGCGTQPFPAGDDPKNAEPPGIKTVVVAVAEPPVVEVLSVRRMNGPW